MMHTLAVMLTVYFVFELVVILSYLPRMRFWRDGLKPQKKLHADRMHRFAVVLPARDESRAIPPLIRSLGKQTYPKEYFDIHLIVKDPDDPTIAMMKQTFPDACVYVVPDQTRKADAMDVCMKKILAEQAGVYDDFIVVDADSVLTPGFLAAMNDATASGAEVIIPRKCIKNRLSADRRNRTLICDCSAMTYVAIDAMGNKGKCRRGQTLSLCGQGMLIRASVIEALGGYPFRTLTEDYEIAVACMEHGWKQYYYEYAVLYSEEPVTMHEYDKRRVRWLRGYLQCGRLYGRKLRRITYGQRRIATEHFQFLYGIYPICFMFGGDAAMAIVFAVTACVYWPAQPQAAQAALGLAFVPLLFAYLKLIFYAAVQILSDRDGRMTAAERVRYLFLSPFLTFDWARVLVIALFSGHSFSWEPVKRLLFEDVEHEKN